MRYTSVFSVNFHAHTAEIARSIAAAHHEQVRDMLRVEGADHPSDVTLDHIYADDSRGDVLVHAANKHIQ